MDHSILSEVKQDSAPALPCSGTAFQRVCPLSKVQVGTVVCVRELNTSPEVTARLREMGIIEESRITLLASQANLICMVCNGRLGLSHKLAESILVQELPTETTAAAAC
jgi:Fe2+ transport system protein FeoA